MDQSYIYAPARVPSESYSTPRHAGQIQAGTTPLIHARVCSVRRSCARAVHASISFLIFPLNPLRIGVSRIQAVCEKPFLAKFQKGAKLLAAWDALATSISTVPDFAFTGGVTGRGCRVKYKEMMAAHRREVKRGEFTSGVREGMDDATHEALNACMQHEDEAEENATKSKGEVAANEAAKRDRAEKVGYLFFERYVSKRCDIYIYSDLQVVHGVRSALQFVLSHGSAIVRLEKYLCFCGRGVFRTKPLQRRPCTRFHL